MSWLEVWEIVLLPIIQFLIGPILVGVVVFTLTDRKNRIADKEDSIRQLNIIGANINKLIIIIDRYLKEKKDQKEYKERLHEMELGDFSNVKEEIEEVGSKDICFELFNGLINDSNIKMGRLSAQINVVFNDLKIAPKDKIPTKIHKEIIEIVEHVEHDQIKIDPKRYRALINEINKLT